MIRNFREVWDIQWENKYKIESTKYGIIIMFRFFISTSSLTLHAAFCYINYFKQALIEEIMEKSVKYTNVEKSYKDVSSKKMFIYRICNFFYLEILQQSDNFLRLDSHENFGWENQDMEAL
jgi:hypothetical protein